MIPCIVVGWYQRFRAKDGQNIPPKQWYSHNTQHRLECHLCYLELSHLIASILFITGMCLKAGIMNRPRAGRPWKLGAIPRRKKESFLLPVVQIGSVTNLASHSKGTKSC
jgi:hypothetical protein